MHSMLNGKLSETEIGSMIGIVGQFPIKYHSGRTRTMRFWIDVDALGKLSRILPYATLVLGFTIAFSGQFLKGIVDSRIAKLREGIEVERKNTRPLVEVRLGHLSSTGEIVLEIDPKNDIPFEASWLVTTTDNIVVSPIMTEKAKIVPKEKKRFIYRVTINQEKVANNYIELRFSFKSMYSDELGNPPHLSDDHTRRYRFVNGRVQPFRL